MTSDAASTPPRKRSWKRLVVALACVVAVTIIALLANTPKNQPVTVRFVRSTNELGIKKLVFEGMNGLPREIKLFAGVVTGAIHHAKAPAPVDPVYGWTITIPAAGTNFYFTLEAPSNDVPYYVMWWFYDIGSFATRWGRLRMGCRDFFRTHGMPRLAERFAFTADVHYIPSTEIKE
jgi:hypothetical protein